MKKETLSSQSMEIPPIDLFSQQKRTDFNHGTILDTKVLKVSSIEVVEGVAINTFISKLLHNSLINAHTSQLCTHL